MPKKRLLAAVLAAGLTVGTAGPAFGTGDHDGKDGKDHKDKKVNCNAGRGNGSEFVFVFDKHSKKPIKKDCDPGNSGGHNQGGD